MFGLLTTELSSTGLPKELWIIISTDNPTTYYKLLQTSKLFQLDTDTMKAKFIRKSEINGNVYYRLPNGWLHSCIDHSGVSTIPAEIYANGDRHWYVDGKKHRDNDQPSEIYADGTQRWYINNIKHRDNDQPASIWADGSQFWYIDNKLHRDNDQPAEIWADGSQHWYVDGKLHRDNDQPAEIYADGTRFWFIDGKPHHDNDKPTKMLSNSSQY